MTRKVTDHDLRREMSVLIALLRYRQNPTGNDDLMQILDLLERSITMEVITAAFAELQADTEYLLDPDQDGEFGAAVAISLDRDQFGSLSINVKLNQIEGGQLSYVLGVARKYELEVREESGWLRLSPHLVETEDTADDDVEETVSS